MGSRRTTTRSLSENGRSINGDNMNGSSRPGSCSYLSNVRPENRSTLCSMIAQLTEETQPCFETTLKSKAVSENCNVKFSCVVRGHPTPQVTWYKNDMQLDRYCGLPKYEIFRNGQTHSLHIYNCTMEDAAIYQASASNSKGIVSCSGVLEVGEMNEFKIHQRYFAKLKQKAELRRKEAEGKENLEPLRTISPERTLRKRRSTMEAFLSMPSSKEDKCNEEIHEAATVETESVVKGEEKLLSVTNGAGFVVTNGHSVNDNGNKGGTYTYDSSQKIFTAHQPKTPSFKKKMKISNSAKVAKSDTPVERASDDRRSKEETLSSAALACTVSVQSTGSFKEVLEVEKIVAGSDSRNMTKLHEKSATEVAKPVNRPLMEDKVCVTRSQKEQITASRVVAPAVIAATSHTASGTEGKQAGKDKKKAENIENLEIQSPYIASTQTQSATALNTLKEYVTKTEDVVVMDIDEMSNTSTGGSLLYRHLESADMPYESRTLLSQRPCEQADHLTEEEISQKNVSVSQPAWPSEAPTTKRWNDAAVSPELPFDQCTMDAQPSLKIPLETETTSDDTQTSSLNCGPQVPNDEITQETWHCSTGSSESLFTDPQKSPLESPDGGENTKGCNVSTPILQSHDITATKSSDGTGKQVDERAGMESEITATQAVEQNTETPSSKIEESSSALHNVKPNKSESASQNIKSSEQIIDLKEIPKPASKVISIAELLRAQLKALESTLENSVQSDSVQGPATIAMETCQELREDERILEVKKSTPHRETGTNMPDKPPPNIKETLMEIYYQLNISNQEQIQTQGASPPPAPVLQNPLVIPPISVTARETRRPHGSDKSYNESVMDIVQETGVSTHPGSENVRNTFHPVTSNGNLTVSQRSGTPVKGSNQESNIVLEDAKNESAQGKDMELLQKSTQEIKFSNKSDRGITKINYLTILDQCKIKGHNANCSSMHSVQSPTEGVFGTATQENNFQLLHIPQKRTSVSSIPCATQQELASGARRKILTPKTKPEEVTEAAAPVDNQNQKMDVSTQSSRLSTSPVTFSMSPSLCQLQLAGERTSPVERHSPLLSRRKETPQTQPTEEITTTQKTEAKSPETDKHNPFKAPQVIRKIRSESFTNASGHLKLWCQFFNVLSDSKIKWYKDEEEIAQMKRNTGDETQVNLAIVQASCKDSGVYGCSITNKYGTDSTDLLLSADILARMSLHEDLGVGEEIEMTPLIFSKGVADSGVWGNKLFGRIMMQESYIGDGCSHKVWRAKVIYGLEPVFESGNTCIIKVRSPISYGGKEESCLIDRNLDIVKQECKIQNLAREYCKIFSAEARVTENFGPCLEVIPVYLMYRPANTIPYATLEADLTGVYQNYSYLDYTGLNMRSASGVEQKCCALQHWLFQWTNGNLLLTRLEGVDTKITNVGISVKSTGHQGLSVEGNPKVFEQFVSQHQCNYFCGLLGLMSLKIMDSLLTPSKPKGSRSPLLQRKMAAGSSSPQMGRKTAGSPRQPRKAEQEGRKTPTKQKAADAPNKDEYL